MNIYIDVLFAVNVWMNVGILLLTGVCLKYRRQMSRIFLGASLGAFVSCILAVYPILPRWGELFFTYFFVGPAMCLAAFRRNGRASLCREAVVLAAVSIFIGGFLNQLYFHTRAGYVMRELLTGKNVQGGGIWVLLLLATASFFAGKGLIRLFYAVRREREVILPMALYRNGQRIEVTALLDTGNRLYEPVTGKPVSIGEREALLTLFPEGTTVTEGCFMIPYHSIGGSGILPGRRLEKMAVVGEDGTEFFFPGTSFFIALKEGPLSGNRNYQLILHGDFAEYTASFLKKKRKHPRGVPICPEKMGEKEETP